MNFTPASFETVIAFGIVVLSVISMLLAAIYYSSRRLLENYKKTTLTATALLVVWLGTLSFIIQSGILKTHMIPGIPLYYISILILVFWFSFSHWGAKIALAVPITFLVGFQVFRLPVELIFDLWAEQRTIPVTMTWAGQNFDVVTGLLALMVAPLTGRYRIIAWVFNILGIILLVNLLRVGAMSSPFPFAWGVDPTLQLVLHWPYALAGPVCVGGALAGHVILTRALLYH